MTEKEKMLAGELYDPLDSELVQARDRARCGSAAVRSSPPFDALGSVCRDSECVRGRSCLQ